MTKILNQRTKDTKKEEHGRQRFSDQFTFNHTKTLTILLQFASAIICCKNLNKLSKFIICA